MPLGAATYDILIGDGLLDSLPGIVERTCPAARYAVIADATVAERFGGSVCARLGSYRSAELVTFPAGEWNKTRRHWSELSDALLARGFGRDAAVVALGGGVTGDLAGFVAATLFRGIPYVQVPTTLLAMIDSSIGGKTGVDTSHGKNLIGAFHQPRAVVADVATLASLPAPHVAAGMAEALKHGAIADAGYFERCTRLRDVLQGGDREALIETVARSVAIKAAVVAEDERERGRRATLNFGHTIAHALEAAAGYALLHGEAVAVGMVLEAELGTRLGITEPGTAETLRAALAGWNLPTTLPDARAEDLMDAMRRDKKSRSGSVKFALLQRIGQSARNSDGSWAFSAPEEAIRSVLLV